MINSLLNQLESAANQLEQQLHTTVHNGDEVKNRLGRINAILQKARANIDQYGPITPEMVRETFYNESAGAVGDAVKKNLMTKDDITNAESFVYLAVPALGMLKIIQHAKDVQGITLVNNRVVNENNCPEEFKLLYKAMINPITIGAVTKSVKDRINSLNAEEFAKVERICTDNPKLASLPETEENKALARLASIVKDAAYKITQQPTFHRLSEDVLSVGAFVAN